MIEKYVAVGAVVLAAVVCGPVSADMYFEDKIDYWNLCTYEPDPSGVDAVPIVEGAPLRYTHDLRDLGIPDQYLVTDATLELDFTNDIPCLEKYLPFLKEYARVAAWDPEAGTWDTFWDVGEVDNSQYLIILETELITDINTDGLLGVQISITNGTCGPGTAWLDHSRLYGEMCTVPVPGAALLGVLGLAYAGKRLRNLV